MDSFGLWLLIVAATSLAAAGLAAPAGVRARLAMLGGAFVLAPVLVAVDNWDTERFAELRDSPAQLLAALLAALVAIAVLVWLVRRRPRWLPIALIAVLPFRVPIELGGDTSNLLVPLYGLLAAGLIAALLEPERILPALSGTDPGRDPRRWLAPVLAATLVLYGLQTAYTGDLGTAVENVGFFFVPFAVLFALLAGARWDRELLRGLVIVVGAAALLVAIVAFGQYAAGKVFWNDKLIDGNEAHAYFRVNSVFYDPNIMGRFLDVALVMLAGVAAWGRRREAELAAAAWVVVLAALVITFSQSSMLALIGGMLVVAAARWGLIKGIAAGALTLAAIGFAVYAVEDGGLTAETTGRTGLISGGLELFEDKPIEGYGAGSFPDEFRQRFEIVDPGYATESHTEPVTVLAEQGVIGIVPYVALLAVAIAGMWTASGFGLAPARDPVAATLFAAFAAMVVHSLGYAAFLTDPLTWALLALALVLPEAIGARAGAADDVAEAAAAPSPAAAPPGPA